MFWRPQVALFVNESTLFPILLPFAPAASVIDRFKDAVESVFAAQNIDSRFVQNELAEMKQHRIAKTQNRSVVGVMNEFVYLAGARDLPNEPDGLTRLSGRLAETPCSPLYGRHVSPDRELAAIIVAQMAPLT